MITEVVVGKIKIPNPTMLASGIVGISSKLLSRVLEMGAGAVVTKSFSVEPRRGYENPVICELPHGVLNAIGLSNPGVKDFLEELRELSGKNVIASVFGADPIEFVKIIELVDDFVKGYEINFSCPHAKGVGIEVGRDSNLVEAILREVVNNTDRPVWAKFSVEIPDLLSKIKIYEEYIDAIVITNTIRGMAIDIWARRPILTAKIGGYSGPAIKPIALRAVYELYEKTEIDIIGCGGIMSGYDVIEFMMAGAKAVQIGTAVYYRGLEVFSKILEEIRSFMEEENIENLNEIVGVAHV